MSDKKPLYKQIMDKLKERIKSGDFEYDAPFVTEDRITKEYGVSRITAIRALEELEHDGLINRKRGSGSFVSKNAMSILGKNKEDNAAVTIHKKNRDISSNALTELIVCSIRKIALSVYIMQTEVWKTRRKYFVHFWNRG